MVKNYDHNLESIGESNDRRVLNEAAGRLLNKHDGAALSVTTDESPLQARRQDTFVDENRTLWVKEKVAVNTIKSIEEEVENTTYHKQDFVEFQYNGDSYSGTITEIKEYDGDYRYTILPYNQSSFYEDSLLIPEGDIEEKRD